MLRVSPEPINAAGIVMDITIALARYTVGATQNTAGGPKDKKHLLNRFCDSRNLIDQDLIQKA